MQLDAGPLAGVRDDSFDRRVEQEPESQDDSFGLREHDLDQDAVLQAGVDWRDQIGRLTQHVHIMGMLTTKKTLIMYVHLPPSQVSTRSSLTARLSADSARISDGTGVSPASAWLDSGSVSGPCCSSPDWVSSR